MGKVRLVYYWPWLLIAICPLTEAFATSFIGKREILAAIPTQLTMGSVGHADDLVGRAQAMHERALNELPLTEAELDGVMLSIRNVYPIDGPLDFVALRQFLSEVAHLSHKNWTRTGKNSETLAQILIPDGMSSHTRHLLARIVQEGNWDGAEQHAEANITHDLPWAVLVTGVNGIRKTTSIYQPWFQSLLAEALVAPAGQKAVFDTRALPSGQTAFFRQLGKFV
jgi:ABC-type cobalt transport system substrate-binding protein